MSLPFLRIGTPVYATSSEVMTIPMVGKRLRGSQQQLRVDGFSQSKTFNISRGSFVGSYTFSVTDLETSTASTSPTTTYVPATVDWTFGGTALSGDEVNFGTDLGIRMQDGTYTFGDTYSVSDAIDLLAATISFAGLSSSMDHFGFSAERVGTNVLRISAPWGAYYNGLNSNLTLSATGSFTASSSLGSPTFSEFLGGVTQYNLEITVPGYRFDAGTKTFNFEVGTYAVGS